ncbi:hypothetical protein DM02DRAFT_632810 [Periconia macrospinosa]|uniref:Uncharacterized protein n=1 Tax=Periconia macrospinosa TaxID=97972 RepID=A0A2V1DC05_9PLEO|nr:hypothetical protein DM02DRAFT_632810 [Periconia macrospinosa]
MAWGRYAGFVWLGLGTGLAGAGHDMMVHDGSKLAMDDAHDDNSQVGMKEGVEGMGDLGGPISRSGEKQPTQPAAAAAAARAAARKQTTGSLETSQPASQPASSGLRPRLGPNPCRPQLSLTDGVRASERARVERACEQEVKEKSKGEAGGGRRGWRSLLGSQAQTQSTQQRQDRLVQENDGIGSYSWMRCQKEGPFVSTGWLAGWLAAGCLPSICHSSPPCTGTQRAVMIDLTASATLPLCHFTNLPPAHPPACLTASLSTLYKPPAALSGPRLIHSIVTGDTHPHPHSLTSQARNRIRGRTGQPASCASAARQVPLKEEMLTLAFVLVPSRFVWPTAPSAFVCIHSFIIDNPQTRSKLDTGATSGAP